MSQKVPSRSVFRSKANAVPVLIGDNRFLALPKLFKTGSYGFYHSGKLPIAYDDELLLCQVSLSVVVIGSKDAPSMEGLTPEEAKMERDAYLSRSDALLTSPLYPVDAKPEKASMPAKASGVPQDASGASAGPSIASEAPNASTGTPEARKTKHRVRKGGEK